MPRLGDDHERLLQTGQELNKRAKRTWDEFANFALSENVLEVAVGLMYNSPVASPIEIILRY